MSGCNFSGADIRSTNFTGATLCGVNFSKVETGLQRRWAIGLTLVSCMLATISGFFSAFAGALIPFIFTSEASSVIAGWVALIVLVILLGIILRKGTDAVIVAFAIAVVIAFAFAFAFVRSVAVAGAFVVTGTLAVAGAGVFAGTIAFAFVGIVTGTVGVAFTFVFAFAGIVAFVFAFPYAGALAYAGPGTVVGVLISAHIGWRSLTGDPRDTWIRLLAVTFAAIGGTSFRHANLNQTIFNQANLKSSDLRWSTLTLSSWHQSKNLDCARVLGTIFLNSRVRELAVSHRGAGQSYKRLNLRGVHLAGADLCDADLTEADISNATLEGAWLERANLTKTQALGTNFCQAQLTGACLENWSINHETDLEGAICEHIYLLNGQKERRPNSGNFAPGEFAKLFEEVLDTIDLIFRNGLDWRAFTASFKQVQVENEGVELSVKSIEDKGDRVWVVRLKTSPETNKEKIHSDFNRNYEVALKALDEKYQAKLAAKEEQITIYRQQSADMREIIAQMASRPINITTIAESKAMQGQNRIAQNVSASPGSNISAFQGKQNQVTQTQSTRSQFAQEEVIAMLAQLKNLIDAAEIPPEMKIEANAHLKVAQRATEQEAPKKEIALANLESMAETLKGASKTVEAGKTLWGQVAPILVKIGAWLGAAAGSLLTRL